MQIFFFGESCDSNDELKYIYIYEVCIRVRMCSVSYFCVFRAKESFLDISPIPGKWLTRYNKKKVRKGQYIAASH